VLLSVQRMTILATLAVLVGTLCYLVGRRRLMDGERGGLAWVLASPLFAGLGLLGKESAILLPFLLFVTEWTSCASAAWTTGPPCPEVVFVGIAALPLALGHRLPDHPPGPPELHDPTLRHGGAGADGDPHPVFYVACCCCRTSRRWVCP